jgi:FkbM family methyltransferase
MFRSIKKRIVDTIRRIVGISQILNDLQDIKMSNAQYIQLSHSIQDLMMNQSFNSAYAMYKELGSHDDNQFDFDKDKFDALLLISLYFSESTRKYTTLTSQRGLFHKSWIHKTTAGDEYLDIKGVKLTSEIPNFAASGPPVIDLIFQRSLLIHTFFNDNYDKHIVETLDQRLGEGARGYTDGEFDVTVKGGDTVIDAGAWIGDFSAYAAYRGATVYAFEPTSSTFKYLSDTAKLNDGKIHPEQMVLSDTDGKACFLNLKNSAGNRMASQDEESNENIETIQGVCLDTFVRERNIAKVDFIKADIQGAERKLLMGAKQTLRDMAPNLVIATDHLYDDPIILKKIILEANPQYRIVQLRTVLFASVVK